MTTSKQKAEVKEKGFREELLGQMITLSTSGFGFVAALAWNETIQQIFKDYLEPSLPNAGILTQLLYAIIVTILAVFITYQLTRMYTRLQNRNK